MAISKTPNLTLILKEFRGLINRAMKLTGIFNSTRISYYCKKGFLNLSSWLADKA
jgi:hypothetical protein